VGRLNNSSGGNEVREGVAEVGVVAPRVIVQEGPEGGAVLGRVEHQDQGAEVGGILDVRLGGVEVGVDVQQAGHQGEGEGGVVGAQVLIKGTGSPKFFPGC